MTAAKPSKKPYIAPHLEELKLEGEEMAAASCKTTISMTGPAVGCIDSGCKSIGS
jgi:hypothetical protein